MDKVLNISVRPRSLGAPPIGFLLSLPLLALPLGGWLVESGLLTLARCSFKTFFGVPCMGCGATRATLNALHGDWLEALYFQPLAISLYLLMIAWGAASLWLYITGRHVEIEMRTWLTWTVRVSLVLLPFANWGYLVSRGI